jgi:hypothetical protein
LTQKIPKWKQIKPHNIKKKPNGIYRLLQSSWWTKATETEIKKGTANGPEIPS